MLSYGVLHFGDHNIQAGVRAFRGEEAYAELVREAGDAFERAEFAEVIRLLDRHFEGVTFSLKSLFRDEQRKAVGLILEATLADVEASLGRIYEHHAQLMRFLADLGSPPPRALHVAAEFTLNARLRKGLEGREIDLEHIRSLLESAARENVMLDASGLGYAFGRALERLMERLRDAPLDLSELLKVEAMARVVETLPFEVDFWKAQNLYYDLLRSVYPELHSRADGEAQIWLHHFTALGEKLAMRVG